MILTLENWEIFSNGKGNLELNRLETLKSFRSGGKFGEGWLVEVAAGDTVVSWTLVPTFDYIIMHACSACQWSGRYARVLR